MQEIKETALKDLFGKFLLFSLTAVTLRERMIQIHTDR